MKTLIIFRDQVSYLERAISEYLWEMHSKDLHIIDHESTYPRAVEYLRKLEQSGFNVHYAKNKHPRDLWKTSLIEDIVGVDEYYAVSDADILFRPEQSFVDKAKLILEKYSDVVKVGPMLDITNVNPKFEFAEYVKIWEAQYLDVSCIRDFYSYNERNRYKFFAAGYDAPIDTTYAIYRPLSVCRDFVFSPAVRMCAFAATHLPWTEDSSKLSEDVIYYLKNATPGISHWKDPIAYVSQKTDI